MIIVIGEFDVTSVCCATGIMIIYLLAVFPRVFSCAAWRPARAIIIMFYRACTGFDVWKNASVNINNWNHIEKFATSFQYNNVQY